MRAPDILCRDTEIDIRYAKLRIGLRTHHQSVLPQDILILPWQVARLEEPKTDSCPLQAGYQKLSHEVTLFFLEYLYSSPVTLAVGLRRPHKWDSDIPMCQTMLSVMPSGDPSHLANNSIAQFWQSKVLWNFDAAAPGSYQDLICASAAHSGVT